MANVLSKPQYYKDVQAAIGANSFLTKTDIARRARRCQPGPTHLQGFGICSVDHLLKQHSPARGSSSVLQADELPFPRPELSPSLLPVLP
nr:hypothetical protein CFP56_07503 [Quercus suber]